MAIPTEIGKFPPTMAEDNILCFGKHRAIEFPLMILFSKVFSGTPFSKH